MRGDRKSVNQILGAEFEIKVMLRHWFRWIGTTLKLSHGKDFKDSCPNCHTTVMAIRMIYLIQRHQSQKLRHQIGGAASTCTE
jgi:hypothetical protein